MKQDYYIFPSHFFLL